VTIDSGKKYSQTVKQAFHVSMAALDLNGKKSSENVQVMLQHDDSSEFLLCTLNDKVLQQSLDLNFETGEEVAFSLNGAGVVHLTGYLALGDDEFDEESYSGSDEEVPSLVETPDSSAVATGTKRKKSSAGSTPKKVKLSTSSMLDEADSDDDDDDDEEEEDEDFSDDFDDDSEDDEEEEEEDDDEEEKFSTPAQKVKSPKAEKSAQKVKGEQSNNTPKQSNKKKSKTPQQNTPSANKAATEKPETPSAVENGESSQKKKKKKKKKKNNDGDSSMNDSTASTPAQTPKTPKTETTPKKRVVAGGTVVEDLKVGHGPEAKPGKMVSVYYVGTLAKNQKRFDSCQGGKPFRFRLNQGEVIKGWDNGVNGMKVGGKRKITVPANQGYGNVKQGPIPPNSTLVFEVELKAVN
ncbi:peptidylprolyl isomerase, partial [Elysia marginata]